VEQISKSTQGLKKKKNKKLTGANLFRDSEGPEQKAV